MIEFARNTPLEVANWLRAQLAAMPNDPILRALATDERMSSLWAELGKWQSGALALVTLAVHFSTPTILSIRQRPPEERFSLSWPGYLLGVAADDFAMKLEYWSSAATELWGEPVDPPGRTVENPTVAFPTRTLRVEGSSATGSFEDPSISRGGVGAVLDRVPSLRPVCGHANDRVAVNARDGEVIGRKIWLQ
jgi:hypothetical protein